METLGRGELKKAELIWLCGRPRFLRETLAQVLNDAFHAIQVHEVSEVEPPTMKLPQDACWMIWFLNGKWDINGALEKIAAPPARLNLLLIQSDGRAFVRWANRQELHKPDISLQELVHIVKTTLDEWQSPFRSCQGGQDVAA